MTCDLPPEILGALREMKRTIGELTDLDAPLKKEMGLIRTEKTKLVPLLMPFVTNVGVTVHAQMKVEPGIEPASKTYWVHRKPPKLAPPVKKLTVSQFHAALDKFATQSALKLKTTTFNPTVHITWLLGQKPFLSGTVKKIVSDAVATVSASKMSKESISVSYVNPRKNKK